MRTITLLTAILFLSLSTRAQVIKEWGLGVEVAYNIPITGVGFGVRSHLHFSERWFISPQVSYFPGITQVKEFYAGVNLNFNFTPSSYWGLYALAGGYYNNWMNYTSFNNSLAKPHNINAEVGGGIVKNTGCWRPFLEYRANTQWWESNLRLGILVYFQNCGKHEVCPAYTAL